MEDQLAEVLKRLGLNPSQVSFEELPHNRWLTSGIWEVSWPGQRAVLKLLALDPEPAGTSWDAHWTKGAEHPTRWNYWAREGLAYRHRLVDAYEAGGIGAPGLLAAHYAEDAIALLLEFVDGRPAEGWEIADYVTASRALGRAQGMALADASHADHPWLSRRFLREYCSEKPVDWELLDDDVAWAQPLVSDNVPAQLRREALWLHRSRDRLLAIAEAAPRVLAHLDFWTKNLIMRPDGRITLLDWSFAGDGAIGEDIGNLVPDAAFDHFVAAASLPILERSSIAAYTEGLAEAGWTGDPRLVELGVCAAAIKYDWLTPALLASASAPRQLRYGGTEEIDADHRFRERGLALLDNARRARRALSLAADLGR